MKDFRWATRRHFTAKDEISIVLDGLRSLTWSEPYRSGFRRPPKKTRTDLQFDRSADPQTGEIYFGTIGESLNGVDSYPEKTGLKSVDYVKRRRDTLGR